jgi:phosphatidylinositol alpha-mannosyltransferase
MGLRIAFTHEFSWPLVRRGGERYMHELAASLARRGHDVTIVAGSRFPSVRTEDGVRVIRLLRGTATEARTPRAFYGALRAILTAGRFDVVHSLGPSDAAVSIRAKKPHRRRATVHTDLGNPTREWWSGRPNEDDFLEVVRSIDVYGCLSRFSMATLEREFGRRGVLTPGGVRLDTFRPVCERDAVPTLLYSGILTEPRKGLATLLRAMPIVHRTHPGVRLLLSGSGDPTEILGSAAPTVRDHVEVLPLGTIADQPLRYSRAWATVLPSRWESFGLVLVESLACGTPIVAGNSAALPELVSPGVGVLAEPEDAVSVADACVEALDLAANIATRDACRDAARRHDWDTSVTPLTEGVYLEAM